MLDFKVRKWKDHMVVSYDCACGCHPMAHYYQGSAEAGHEHCCCGNVHFAGPEAERQLHGYLAQRRAEGEDQGLVYAVHLTQVTSLWGELLPVAYGLPSVEGEAPPPAHHHAHGQ